MAAGKKCGDRRLTDNPFYIALYLIAACLTCGYMLRDAYEDDGDAASALFISLILGAIWPATLVMMAGWYIRKAAR